MRGSDARTHTSVNNWQRASATVEWLHFICWCLCWMSLYCWCQMSVASGKKSQLSSILMCEWIFWIVVTSKRCWMMGVLMMDRPTLFAFLLVDEEESCAASGHRHRQVIRARCWSLALIRIKRAELFLWRDGEWLRISATKKNMNRWIRSVCQLTFDPNTNTNFFPSFWQKKLVLCPICGWTRSIDHYWLWLVTVFGPSFPPYHWLRINRKLPKTTI